MCALLSFLFLVLLLSGVCSASQAGLDDSVPSLTEQTTVLVLTREQMADLARRAEAGEAEAQFIWGAAFRDGGPLVKRNQVEAA